MHCLIAVQEFLAAGGVLCARVTEASAVLCILLYHCQLDREPPGIISHWIVVISLVTNELLIFFIFLMYSNLYFCDFLFLISVHLSVRLLIYL